jgi:hypothetical protein
MVGLVSPSYIDICWFKVRDLETVVFLLCVDVYRHRKTHDLVHS